MVTSFSWPVRYANLRLASTHASWSSDAAAWSSRSQLSINCLEYARVAPKSTSSTLNPSSSTPGENNAPPHTHLPRLRIPKEIRPIRIRLHHPKLKQLLQTQLHNPRRYLKQHPIRLEYNFPPRKKKLTSSRSLRLNPLRSASPTLTPSTLSITNTLSVLPSHTHGTLNLSSPPKPALPPNALNHPASFP